MELASLLLQEGGARDLLMLRPPDGADTDTDGATKQVREELALVGGTTHLCRAGHLAAARALHSS